MTYFFAIIIKPLVQILEFFYSVFFKITENEGLSVIGLSFVVTFCTLPLYMVAEAWQEKERQIQEQMKPGVDRIKSVFKGDEQYMILSTYYKQNHYHPLMALRSSFSLLIQIPFFMAAYNFLSNLEALKGVSFLFINDFGNPDATFYIGTFAVNILPIAMTLINIISGIIYSKGHPLSEKIQIFVCAAVFLVLLYSSPSGLVVYWTMNNILSMVKNIFYKIKNPKKVLYIISCIIAFVCILFPFTPFKTSITSINFMILGIGLVIPVIPFVLKGISSLIYKNFKVLESDKKLNTNLFFLSACLLLILTGLTIPSIIMESEPANYCYIDNNKSPFVFLFYTACVSAGLFVFWPGCFFGLFSSKIKKSFTVIFSILSTGALINTFAFSGNYGSILPECLFMFEQTMTIPLPQVLINALVLILSAAVIVFLLNRYPKILKSIQTILCVALMVIVVKNTFVIGKEFKKMDPPVVQDKIEPSYHLSKEGRNVIVIMQDRLHSPFVNLQFDERPELISQFEGFTYYPNTTSMGWLTMLGSPSLFGGYDYTPYEINKRKDETLQQKHNQSLLTMPYMFHEAGFETTVSHLPYENYLEYPVTDMYKDAEYVTRAETCGLYTDLWYRQNNFQREQTLSKAIKRNMIWFSIFKMVPPVLRDLIYYKEYWNSDYRSQSRNIERFIYNYSELDYLPEMTDFSASKDSFILLDNEMTHEPMLLQYPDYTPAYEVTQFGTGPESHNPVYTTTGAALIKFADFFKYLKDNDVYDNTRIIIVSDHGAGEKQFDQEDNIPGLEKSYYTCALLVKDFNCHGELKKDMTFMTNADTPFLATKDIVENQVNPFTGSPLKIENKNYYTILAGGRPESTRARYKSQFSIEKDEWFYVKDNIFSPENWGKFETDK
ncbi:MAG: membrane protein insertase YidC [Treponema sp.]|nr:membrane protein insertase YidC [Treponema sp.]